jgi:hypothetical protein
MFKMYYLIGIMLLLCLELPQDKIQRHIPRHARPPWYALQKHVVNGRGHDTNRDYKNIIITDNMDCPGNKGVYPDICSKAMVTTRTMTFSKEKQVPRSLAFSFSMRISSSCWLMAFFQRARSSSLLRFTGCCFGLTVPRPLSTGTQQTGDRSIRNVTVVQSFHL